MKIFYLLLIVVVIRGITILTFCFVESNPIHRD